MNRIPIGGGVKKFATVDEKVQPKGDKCRRGVEHNLPY